MTADSPEAAHEHRRERRPPRRVVYLCYLSLEDPLVHSQVLAYLSGLAQRGHFVHLVTWEPRQALTTSNRRRWQHRLADQGIAWHGLRYHRRPSVVATAYDALRGAALTTWLIRRHRLDTVHARSHVPAAMALVARALTGCSLIFDVRGLLADEYADVGHWSRGGAPYRVLKVVERAAITRADGIVVLTERLRQHLFARDPRVVVIPCCADVARIASAASDRNAQRRELGLAERRVLVYVGKFAGWYMEGEMVAFFATARRERPDLHFLVVSQSDPNIVRREFRRQAVPPDAYTVTQAAPEDLGRVLGGADAGMCLVRPLPSKISSSPTKVAEYLAAGLPVLSTAGIGDVDELLQAGRCGVVMNRFDDAARRAAATALFALVDDGDATAERCRNVAREHLDLGAVGVRRYDDLYRRLVPSRRPAVTSRGA